MSSEFDLIRRYFTRPAPDAVLGVGDDCALVQLQPRTLCALSTDMLLEGTHFPRGTDPQKLGWKSLAVNLSDLAAVGADPRFALLAIAMPEADEVWIAAFARGFFTLADRYRVQLIGGDTTRGPLSICITVVGGIPEDLALRRDAAAAGDEVWLSGATGEAALALAHLQGRIRLPEAALRSCLARLETPDARIELGTRLRGLARSAIDISDGLLADLGHIAEASGVAIDVALESLPRAPALRDCQDAQLALECIAAGGDDYELAFTASPSHRSEVEALGDQLGIALTRIGTVTLGEGRVSLRDAQGEPVALQCAGFDHFA
jgi:thiamine-monophosphate kinase